jgi:hypothetical protein
LRRLCGLAHELYKLNFDALPTDVLHSFANQLLPAVERAASDASTVEPGTSRQTTEDTSFGRQTKFLGQESFIKSMKTPNRRVVRLIANDKVILGPPFPVLPDQVH